MYDFLIIGSGVVGMTTAVKLRQKFSDAKIAILEKENSIGQHASGRNSGVIHSGIYYKPESLKSKMCLSGRVKIKDWCLEHSVDIKKTGKCIIAKSELDIPVLDSLIKNADLSNIDYKCINNDELKQVEPNAVSLVDRAIHIPDVYTVSVIDLLKSLELEISKLGIDILFNTNFLHNNIRYGYLINTAGMYSDEVAHKFDVANDYTIIPFRGSYYKLNKTKFINGLIYPVPDLNFPFLGVHFTTSTNGDVYIGPNAALCFGKENYSGILNFNAKDLYTSIKYVLCQLADKKFIKYSLQESKYIFKRCFIADAKKIVPNITSSDVICCNKRGIRAQLVNKKTRKFVDDFLIIHDKKSTHVLNAVSPALTCSFAFADHVVNEISKNIRN